MKSFALLAAAMVSALFTACDQPIETAGRPVVVTVASAVPPTALPEPGKRFPPGSRMQRFDLERPAAPPVELSAGLVAAGGASVSVDGDRVAFVGRPEESDAFVVWTSDPDGGDRRRVEAAPEGAGAVAWLPDERLVVAAPVDGPPPLEGMSSAWALFVVDADGQSAERITFGAGELDPSVLADGRVVYSQWQPGGDGRPAGGSFSLFTVHPDGTGAAQLHGYHGGARLKLLPRQEREGDLVFLAGDSAAGFAARGLDWHRPAEASTVLDLPGEAPRSVEPTAAGELLVADQPIDGDSVLWLLGESGEKAVPALVAPAGSVFVHAVEVAARPRPQGHLSTVDAELAEGHLLCIDARPPGMSEARRVRLSSAAAGGEARVLGEIELAADGSFFAVVPADRSLYLDLLDADGRLLVTGETPFWVRPSEVRACVGCHESPHTAPPNRRPLAVRNEPVDLTEGSES